VVLLQKGLTLTWEEATYLKSRAVAHYDEGVRGVEEVSIGEFARRSLLSVKALRLYDELGVLKPARVDDASGYRFYDLDQLADARLVAMLRQLEFPLATIKELLACSPVDAADRIAEEWQQTEAAHESRRDLATYLVNQLRGERSIMYEVATREVPERSLLCLKRNVDPPGAWALGKKFVAILRERSLPKLGGREGAMFSIYWSEVSADSDGPVEWCRPVPEKDASALALLCPELNLRTEPAHREAYVALPDGAGDDGGVQVQLASEALRAWAEKHSIGPGSLSFSPEELGVRITYLASEPGTKTNAPYCDFAVPFV